MATERDRPPASEPYRDPETQRLMDALAIRWRDEPAAVSPDTAHERAKRRWFERPRSPEWPH